MLLSNDLPLTLSGLGIPLAVAGATILLIYLYTVIDQDRPLKGFPIVSLDGMSPKKSWFFDGQKVVSKGLEQCSGPFQVITGTGPKIILPNRYAEELRSNPHLHLHKAFQKDFFVNYPGFEGSRQGLLDDRLMQDTVRIKLTQSLNLITNDLVDETRDALHDIFGEGTEWQTVLYKQKMLDVVARLSSRVFLGEGICRNERWLDIAKTYTVTTFLGAMDLRKYHKIVRPIVHWFIPALKSLRRAVHDAHEIIDPEASLRSAVVRDALEKGKKPPKASDTLGWMYEIATATGRKVDYSAAQLSLTLAAIHTTTEVTSRAMIHICQTPGLIDELREEAARVIAEHGWVKTTLYKLKLLDSVLKESQRHDGMSVTSMNRWVDEDVQLSDGTILPKNSRIMVCDRRSDPTVFPEPEKFIPTRFLELRSQEGQENNYQVVASDPNHFLWGYGQHACPGRFFAINEIKIAICFMLLKYDWRILEEHSKDTETQSEQSKSVHPMLRLQVRRRNEEIKL